MADKQRPKIDITVDPATRIITHCWYTDVLTGQRVELLLHAATVDLAAFKPTMVTVTLSGDVTITPDAGSQTVDT